MKYLEQKNSQTNRLDAARGWEREEWGVVT